MTIFKITTEDEQADLLRTLLKGSSFIKSIEEERQATRSDVSDVSSSDKIKSLLEEAKGRGLFADINDASEWQREIRKEWDRGF